MNKCCWQLLTATGMHLAVCHKRSTQGICAVNASDPKMPVVKVTVEELKRWEDVPGRLDIGRMYLVDIFRWDPNQSLPLGMFM